MNVVKDESEVLRLTEDELSLLQSLNTELTKAKITIGDLEIKKQSILEQMTILRKDFVDFEARIGSKYGHDCTINVQTGEITK